MPEIDAHLSDEHRAVRDLAREFTAGEIAPHAEEWNAEHHVPIDVLRKLGELGLLGITVPEDVWPELVQAATFDRMRAHADRLAPDQTGVLMDRAAFFRRGSSGSRDEIMPADEQDHYYARTARMAPPDLLAWLHHH